VGAPQREHSVSDATPTDSIPVAPFPPAIYPPPPPSWVWANPPPPQPVPAQRLRIGWIIASAVTAAVVLVVGGLLAALAFATPDPVSVRGELQLNVAGYLAQGAACQGSGGYSDIAPGQEVMLRDASGRLLAATHLTGGRWMSSAFPRGVCTFDFEFANVVIDDDPAALYTIAIGSNDRRGEVPFNREELLAGPGLTIGS
jgi:hypothetical protein